MRSVLAYLVACLQTSRGSWLYFVSTPYSKLPLFSYFNCKATSLNSEHPMHNNVAYNSKRNCRSAARVSLSLCFILTRSVIPSADNSSDLLTLQCICSSTQNRFQVVEIVQYTASLNGDNAANHTATALAHMPSESVQSNLKMNKVLNMFKLSTIPLILQSHRNITPCAYKN